MILTALVVAFLVIYAGVLLVAVPMLLVTALFMLVHRLWKALS